MIKRNKFRINGNNWLLLVVFALTSLTGLVEPLAILTLLATMTNSFLAIVCYKNEDWDKEAFKCNLAEAAIDDKVVSLLVWTTIWAILLRYDYNILVVCSVFARSMAGFFVKVT